MTLSRLQVLSFVLTYIIILMQMSDLRGFDVDNPNGS